MQNVVELLQLYSDINQKVIKHKRNTSREFIRITQIILGIIEALKKIPIKLEESVMNTVLSAEPTLEINPT